MRQQPPLESYDIIPLPWQSPLVIAEKIRPLGYIVWMDSTVDTSTIQSQSSDIITACPERIIYANGTTLTCVNPETKHKSVIIDDPFTYLDSLINRYTLPEHNQDVPFCGGIAGYWGYELNYIIEPKCIEKREHHLPDMMVGLYLWSLVVDYEEKTLFLYCHPQLSSCKKASILRALDVSRKQEDKPKLKLTSTFSSQMTYSYYQYAFDSIKDYILSGDCYQVNLTQQFLASYTGSLWPAYKQLRSVSPTPFSAYIEFDDITVLSHSPERFLKLEKGCIETKPIKGTQPRFASPDEDLASANKLLSSEKDKAENLMIVDLLRNDLNRYCKVNTVKTPQLFSLESYANVHHLVSTVKGHLEEKTSSLQLLKGAFPGGSITGVPKIRAMQIIRELEPVARSVYCGAIGYVNFNGNMDTNIPIRTLIGDGHTVACWGGGGIVADSVCEQEYQESLIKVSNLTTSLEKTFY